MMEYLYKNWAYMGPLIAIYVCLILFLNLPTLGYALFLIWLQFPIYLLHEFEEHGFPGGFKRMVNSLVFKSNMDFPFNDANIFWINILAVWILFPFAATMAQTVDIGWGVLLPIFGIFNASIHVIFTLVKRRYNPGLIISVILNIPTGIYTIYYCSQENILTLLNTTLSLTTTILIHVLLIMVMLVKVRFHKQG